MNESPRSLGLCQDPDEQGSRTLGQERIESCSFKHEKNSLPESKRKCSDVSSFFRQNANFST